jgi:hypothetical protein
MSDTDKLSQLKTLLKGAPPGPVPEALKDAVVDTLAVCWERLEGSREASMGGYKVRRAEDLRWDPPRLRFVVERHGAREFGSKRAELQVWSVDVDEGTASCYSAGYRQLDKPSLRWKAEPVAAELASLILDGKEDLRLKWLRGGKDRVQLQTWLIIPDNGPKKTTSGRRRRLFAALEKHLAPTGWKRTGNTWDKTSG